MSFLMKLLKAICTKKVTVAKVKGKYQTTVDATLFGLNLYSIYRTATKSEKKVARDTAKLIAAEAMIKVAAKKVAKKSK